MAVTMVGWVEMVRAVVALDLAGDLMRLVMGCQKEKTGKGDGEEDVQYFLNST